MNFHAINTYWPIDGEILKYVGFDAIICVPIEDRVARVGKNEIIALVPFEDRVAVVPWENRSVTLQGTLKPC